MTTATTCTLVVPTWHPARLNHRDAWPALPESIRRAALALAKSPFPEWTIAAELIRSVYR